MDSSDDVLEREFFEYASIAHIVKAIDEEMVSPADIQHGIQAVTATLTTLQKAAEIAKRTKTTEISEILTDLRGEIVDTKNLLIDTKAELVSLKEENLELKQEIEKLKAIKAKPVLILKDGFYYGQDGTGPFCPNCYLTKKLEIPLTKGSIEFIKLRCSSCRNNFR